MKYLSFIGWTGLILIDWFFFEMMGHTTWVPNLPFLMVLVLGLYASRTVSVISAGVLSLLELLMGGTFYFHLLWYPAVALGLNYFFYNVFRSHPTIFRLTHLGLILLDVFLSVIWCWLTVQTLPVFHPLQFVIFLISSSLLTYALRWTGDGFFEERKTDRVWRKIPRYRMAFRS